MDRRDSAMAPKRVTGLDTPSEQIVDVSPSLDNTTIAGSWNQSPTGRMLALASSQSQTVFAGSFANLWSSIDDGQTWSQVTWPQPPQDQFGVPGSLGGWCVMDIAISPLDSNIILAITRNDRVGPEVVSGGIVSGIHRTEPRSHFDRLGPIHPQQFPDKGIWRSNDGGSTWARVHRFPSGEAVGQLVWAPGDSNSVFAAGGSSLAVSDDGGAHFADLPQAGKVNHVAVAPTPAGALGHIVYALGDNCMSVSFDGGATWQQDPALPQGVGGSVGFSNSQAPSVLVVSPRSNLQVFLVANANGGQTLGPPSVSEAFVSTFNNQQHFVYQDNVGTIWDAWWDGSNSQWSLQQINRQQINPAARTAGPAAAPYGSLFVSVYNQQQHFVYQDNGGIVWDAFWDSQQWSLQQINAGGMTAGPAAAVGQGPFVSVYNQQQHFAYQDSNGVIWDAFWRGDQNHWDLQQINLGGVTDGPAATAAGGGPFVSTYNQQQHFVYQDDAGTIWDALWRGDQNHWDLQQINAGGMTAGPAAAVGQGPFVSVYNQQQHFAYQDSNGVIWDAFWRGDQNHWDLQQINLGGVTDGPAATAAGGGPFVSTYNQQQHFVYQDDAGTIWDALWRGDQNRWDLQQINASGMTAGPAAASGQGPFVSVYNQQQHFAYQDSNGVIWDALWRGDQNRWDLQQINSGPMLWAGDYSQFQATMQSVWSVLVLPELVDQDNGNVFLAATQPGRGDLLFYGPQRGKVYAGPLAPASPSDWRTLDDDNKVHADLHGIFLSPDFAATIQDGNYQASSGTVWLLSDGGLHRSVDGGLHFFSAEALNTLTCVNVAGVAIEGQGPALSLNTGDNDGFFSADGGANWVSQDYGGGDNDCSFADPLRPNSMLVFTPRWDSHDDLAAASKGQTITVYENTAGQLPNLATNTQDFHTITGPPANADGSTRWNAGSSYVVQGFRPIVLNLPTDDPAAPGDYVFIRFQSGGGAVLVRTLNLLSIQNASDWDSTATSGDSGINVFQQGPQLPDGAIVVQASGGHSQPVFYTCDAKTYLWNWTAGMPGWQTILPGPAVKSALRFFVDPYRPAIIYVLDSLQPQLVRSDDGGGTWQVDDNLQKQLTSDGTIPLGRNEDVDGQSHVDVVLCDMQFHPSDPLTRFAAGLAGVFQTTDGGQTWGRLLDTSAMAGRPVNCYYDWISNRAQPALYVATAGRGLLKIALS